MLALLFAAMLAQAHPLTLDEAVKIGLERNPDLMRQVLLTLSAEQDKVLARSAILPSLAFNASYSDTRQGGGTTVIQNVEIPVPTQVFHNWQGTVSIRQLIFDGGRWWNTIDAASLGYAANVAQVDEQRLQVAYLIEQRFYELVRAQRQLTVLADAAKRSRDQAEFTQRLFEGGRQTQADVYAARANRDNDEVIRLGAERNVELARADLSAAIGLEPGEPLTVVDPPRLLDPPAQPPPPQDAIARALQNRPSLKAFGLAVESNRKLASAAKGDYWPSLAVGVGYQRSARDLNTIFSDPSLNSTLYGAVSLSWNVFNGFSTNANVRKAELQAMLSENDFLSARRGVASDVEKAVAQLAAARAQV
ncbi:MAG: TolC family protein, partial [Myxococcales bacterium]